MGKESGGTRNYNPNSKAWEKRYNEYTGLLATGDYDIARSFFDNSGGFCVTHNEHNPVTQPDVDKSDIAVKYLTEKGYRIYLDSEKTTFSDNGKKKDGRIEKLPMDIKTINTVGKYTIKRAVEKASVQGARAVILFQNTPDMDAKYIKQALYGADGVVNKSPLKVLEKIDWVIVVGANGHVHRHNLIKERHKRGI